MALAPFSLDIDAVTSERQVFVSRHRIRSETHDQAMPLTHTAGRRRRSV